MTTNPGPEYFMAQEKYDAAKTPEEKLRYLQEMYKHAPKHKASERMVAELTWKISQLKKEVEKQKEQAGKKAGGGHSLNVKKDGAGQIAIVGMPNSGKSQLLKALTGADVEIAPYPFTTTVPEIGMMEYNGVKVQLVEVPAIVEGSSHGKANGTQLLSVVRNADAIIIICRDQSEAQVIVHELKNAGIIVTKKKPRITISDTEFSGITIGGKQHLKIPESELVEALKKRNILKANVMLEEPTDMPTLLEALDESLDYKNCLAIKTMEWNDIQELRAKIFGLLEKIIVYTKKPGEDADKSKPLILKKDATVSDAAELVHKDIAKNLKFAKVWGSAKFPGQRVAKEYVLHDGDIIELSA